MAELKLKKFINVKMGRRGENSVWLNGKKAHYGQFFRETESTDDRNRWEWLK